MQISNVLKNWYLIIYNGPIYSYMQKKIVSFDKLFWPEMLPHAPFDGLEHGELLWITSFLASIAETSSFLILHAWLL